MDEVTPAETTEETADQMLRPETQVELRAHCPACGGTKWVACECAPASSTVLAPEKMHCDSCGYIYALVGELLPEEKALNDSIVEEYARKLQEEVNHAAAAHNPEPETRLERIVKVILQNPFQFPNCWNFRKDEKGNSLAPQFSAKHLVDIAVDIEAEIKNHESGK